MATYKVLQDIEAEDKLLGPLTLKQFIFAIITIVIGFINFKIITAPGSAVIKLPFVLVLLIPMIIFGFLAAPLGRDQSNDIWLLARLRFAIRPHKRIWDQAGLSQLVTITAPKKVEHIYTDGLTQGEVKSRLGALANTLDSRGWAVKNVTTNLYSQPDYITTVESDRLLGPQNLPQDVPAIDVTAADDVLDEVNNTTAHNLEQMIQASTEQHKKELTDRIQKGQPAAQQPPADYWFMNQTKQEQPLQENYTTFAQQAVVAPGATPAADNVQVTEDDNALLNKIHHDQALTQPAYGHMHKLTPLHDKEGNEISQPGPAPGPAVQQDNSTTTPVQTNDPAVTKTDTPTPNPAIIGLAQNNDLNVATIARQAQQMQSSDDDEVVISLH